MIQQPQHVKRRCTQKVFASITSGERTFELIVDDDLRLEPGDILTYEEYDEKNDKYTGRRESRKVSYILNTKDLNIPGDEIVRYGIGICGIVVPEFRTLRSVIDFGSIVSFVLHCKGNSQWSYANDPTYIPVFTTPPVMEIGLAQDLQFQNWPVGVFDCTLMIFAAEKRMEFEIIDHAIFAAVRTNDPKNPIISIEMDFSALVKGKPLSNSGEEVELATHEEVNELVMQKDVDSEVDVELTDEFQRQVDELLPENPEAYVEVGEGDEGDEDDESEGDYFHG